MGGVLTLVVWLLTTLYVTPKVSGSRLSDTTRIPTTRDANFAPNCRSAVHAKRQPLPFYKTKLVVKDSRVINKMFLRLQFLECNCILCRLDSNHKES